ncbi:MAG: hypothetical protein R6W76_10630, partial [Caldilinea sp.]
MEGVARSTLAGAIITLDVLRRRAPFTEDDLFTPAGQLIGGRGASLKATLQRYGLQHDFLIDGVTTRAMFKFVRLAQAVEWGMPLQGWSQAEREEAMRILAEPVLAVAAVQPVTRHPKPKHLTVRLDRQRSPLT